MQSVCLGNITDGNLRVEFVKSLLASRDSADGPAVIAETLIHVWGPYLDDSRNHVVDAFLAQSDCDILLFIDSDIAWTPDQVTEIADKIHPESSPVVGGLYYSGFGRDGIGFAPVVYNWGTHPETNQPFMRQLAPDEITDEPLIKVDGIGTGFLGLHREMLLEMGERYGSPQPWFAEETFNNVHHGEDLTFCQRLSEMGVPIYLSPSTRVKHFKVCSL